MQRLLIAAGLLLTAGCSAPASRLPQTQLLTFSVSHMGASTSLVVGTDGTAEYVEEGRPDGALRVKGTVTPEELEKLTALLKDRGFCSLVSTRSHGVPDEARPSVSVRMGGLDCKVQMWDGEFRDEEDAQVSLAAVEALGSAIRARGK